MDNQRGLGKIGYISNVRLNDKNENYLTFLSKLAGRQITDSELDDFIESDDFHIEYYNQEGQKCNEEDALSLKFKLPWPDIKTGLPLYGFFRRIDTTKRFMGVFWQTSGNTIRKIGFIKPTCWDDLSILCNEPISEDSISEHITSDFLFYNNAGYTKYADGTPVTKETGRYIKFQTDLKDKNGHIIVGWFTKGKSRYEGVSWGTEKDFEEKKTQLYKKIFIGRLLFDSIEDCNKFLKTLADKILGDEPWGYAKGNDNQDNTESVYDYPILKSYIEFELDRLFYEQEELNMPDRIIYNDKKDKVLFNTNLLDKYGYDLIIAGDFNIGISDRLYISDPVISPRTSEIKKLGFDSKIEPQTPCFFKDINEIVFHGDWEFEYSSEKYEHIIEERIERFPAKYRKKNTIELSTLFQSAIVFAKKIAQRNYKFIVPMYYPTAKRIQLLMPIYLEDRSLRKQPDFALVLTPLSDEKMYIPETILGLKEVYQDARLIAKPDESWLNPEKLK